MVAIPFPTITAPGQQSQDGSGRLINVYAEPRQNGDSVVWRRAPGAVVFTGTYASTAAMTGTVTPSWGGAWAGGINGGYGTLTGTGTATFVGST